MRVQSLTRSDRIEDFGIAMAVVEMARQQAAKQARGLAHPQLCLDAVQAGIERGGHAGLQTVRSAGCRNDEVAPM
jgi:enoyl-CoA hydratase/3-hydroxyacyl-CoA dehydrogenase